MSTTKEKREKAKKLIALATNRTTPKEERRTAAMQAVVIINKYRLLDNKLDALLDGNEETVHAVKSVVNTVMDPAVQSGFKKVASFFKDRR